MQSEGARIAAASNRLEDAQLRAPSDEAWRPLLERALRDLAASEAEGRTLEAALRSQPVRAEGHVARVDHALRHAVPMLRRSRPHECYC